MDPLYAFKQEWFSHPEWWFNTSMETDIYLVEKYSHWLTENMMEYSMDGSKDTLLAWVILYDQLPRHHARVVPAESPNVYTYLSKAIGLVQLMLQSNLDFGTFSGTEFGFLMLPLRHSYDCRLTFQAMDCMWRKIHYDKRAGNHKYVEELKPFLRATYKRCPMLPLDFIAYADVLQFIPGGTTREFHWDTYRDLLAYSPELLFEGEVFTDQPQWAKGWSIPKSASPASQASPVSSGSSASQASPVSSASQASQASPLLVSLSGGVDSMVLLWVLVKYYPSIPVVAVHINYCNRSDHEEHFVADWCASQGVPLFIRRFREIQRVPAMEFELRDTYESYTKNGRMHAYHLAHQLATTITPASPVVAMGHNQDDCFENILTNICQKQKYENLQGMTVLTETNGIQFWRPMLHVPKQEIYHFAQRHEIPYLNDSTPSWSCRGKIRDRIRPTLQQYHTAMIPAFFHLSNTLAELSQHLEQMATLLVRKTTVDGQLTVSPDDYPTSLWSSVPFWNHYFHKLWDFTPSHKSLLHFTERLNAPTETIRVLLKKGMMVVVHKSPAQWVFKFGATPSSSHRIHASTAADTCDTLAT
jgi:tRNA(Ile)-lysidine synthase